MDEWWVYHRYVTDITNAGGQTSCSTAPLLSSAVPPYVVVFSEAVSKKIEIVDHWSLLLWDLTVLSFWWVLGTLSFLIFSFAWHNAWSDLGSLVRARLRLKQTLAFYAEMWVKQFGNAQSESENDGQVNRHDTPVPPQRLSWVKKSTLWIYVAGSLLRSSKRQVNPSVVVFCCWNRNVWITRALLLILPGPIMPWWLSLECQLGWNSHLQRRLLGASPWVVLWTNILCPKSWAISFCFSSKLVHDLLFLYGCIVHVHKIKAYL